MLEENGRRKCLIISIAIVFGFQLLQKLATAIPG
jgi:hypothetical protein